MSLKARIGVRKPAVDDKLTSTASSPRDSEKGTHESMSAQTTIALDPDRAPLHVATGRCFLGSVLVAQSRRGISAILLGDDPEALVRDLRDRFPHATLINGDVELEQLVARVVGSIEAPGSGLDLPLDLRGTAFQQRVWRALREIPAGSTASYTEVADRIGAPTSVRAVARACAANPLAVAVPCHRVVRNDGALSGYRWGSERKRALLEREVRA